MKIDIKEYTYPLIEEQIARFPHSPRDESKLLVYKDGQISHQIFKQIGDFLPDGAHLVLNDTKVIPARLYFTRQTGALIEIFLLNPLQPSTVLPIVMDETREVVWHCVIGNKKKWKADEVLEGTFTLEGRSYKLWAKQGEDNAVALTWEGEWAFSKVVEAYGNIPLPPYLKRESQESDLTDYQTVYSEHEGAVAAPTAGLHFTDAVFQDLEGRGVKKSFVTLHVGAGTFMPVKEENALNHPMHSEQIIVSRQFLNEILAQEDFIIPVGTTSMRSLESMYWWGVKLIKGEDQPFSIEKLYPYQDHPPITARESFEALMKEMGDEGQLVGNTEIMIFPSYTFRVCKGLITNFHQPTSTLLLLVAALVGEETWRKIYAEAGQQGYRFLSFGDSSLLLP
ncbi:S-adenosylmethionine:tRNA ribosyltransferase-isomerase [Leadbetterella byssophila]|uniref:S-adenosylmethionine:tRNA ribosyltransferase-isomerase n=1 Tax=Leadbetterella byssophila TaxID=316068 RepID=UPI0039A2A837